MRTIISIIIIFGVAGLAFTGDHIIKMKYPSYFPEPSYDFSDNPITPEKIELVRMLFYDPILSKDNSISCASCHSPYNAFAHTDHNLSHGINDSIGTRNAPALFNLAWQKSLMWDGAIHNLDMQALAPISHPGEMGENISNVVRKLKNTERYPKAFYDAWHDSTITGEHFLKSLSQFQLTLISDDSKYDRVKLGVEEFTKQEQLGYELFIKHCNSCHTEPIFSTYGFANNGLPIDTTLNDYGKYRITKVTKDSMKFKIPSLRNLSYSYPYMHDGRFTKLYQVINHYTEIEVSDTSQPELVAPIDLNSKGKVDLVAFLLTLNDETFVFNPNNKFPEILLSTKNKQ